jgi:hypothetical protein
MTVIGCGMSSDCRSNGIPVSDTPPTTTVSSPLTRYPLEGYRERCDTRTVLGTRFASQPEVGAQWTTNYLKALTALARACGKSSVHNLEPDDLVALTVEAAAMARVPLAGTTWVPGR